MAFQNIDFGAVVDVSRLPFPRPIKKTGAAAPVFFFPSDAA
jgi:hypothetical protein